MRHAQSTDKTQAEVLAFLAERANYVPAPQHVERIDTHAAIIFLAGNFAYKVKRAVKLSYLDFSTLEKRRRVCIRELEINRPNAPDIYLDVVPVVRLVDGSLSLGGKGAPVEWAVRMRRFDQGQLLDSLARRNALPLDLMAGLAQTIARLHGSARTHRRFDAGKALAGVIGSIRTSLSDAAPAVSERDARDLARDMAQALRSHAGLMNERARAGFVRRCHGDLHLRNIVLIGGRPTIFDAIEFDEQIATIDILYDIAFLLMDLWHRGLKAHANVLFNSFLRLPGSGPPLKSLDGLALMPLFLAVRAAVRAMVANDRMAIVGASERGTVAREIGEFFGLAREFLRPRRPQLTVVGGLSGTGKSTLAAGLAPGLGGVPGALVVRSDVERKRLAGVADSVRLGPEHYTTAATGRVYAALCAKAEAALSAGQAVILDAVYGRQIQRERVEGLARRLGVPFKGLWLDAPASKLIGRVGARRGDASDADADVVRKQLEYDLGEIRWKRVDASGEPGAVLRRATGLLEKEVR